MIGIVDIGGTKLLTAISSDGVTYKNLVRRDTPKEKPIETLQSMLQESSEGAKLDAITMSVPGPFRRRPPGLVNPPSMAAPWHEIDFERTLGKHFGCPVVAENDANCSALAEAFQGAGRGHRVLVYFTISTGVGTGVVRDGKLEIGRHDTEGGHIVLWPKWLGGPPCECGGFGCLETLCGGREFIKRYGKPAHELDDPDAWNQIGVWLGLAVVDTTALLDPDVVIFGGGLSKSWDRFAASLQDTVAEYLHLQPAPQIRKAELTDGQNNLIGALLNLHNLSE